MNKTKNHSSIRTWKMKIFNIIIFPLAAALVLGGALLATKDYSPVKLETHDLRYTVTWSSRSFDEAVWLAVSEIADIEDSLPREIESFHVEVQPPDEAMPVIHLQFNRVSLAKLKAGEIAPENFIREHVEFN